MALRFEWDIQKAESNLAKHGVSFEEAATAFRDPLSLTIADPDHSDDEHRFVTISLSFHVRTLVEVHADRSDTIRIISARPATRRERNEYEEEA